MATSLVPFPEHDKQPDYLPARMLNEFTYCPRLFFYEWVEGVFRENADTLEGAVQHARVDAKISELPSADEMQEAIHVRSVTLASERLRIIAKMDLVDAEGGVVTPVDYKHGRPREGKDGLELWPADRIQLAAQGVILRENGYRCDEGIVYYRKTGQRVRVQFDDALISELENTVAAARTTAAAGIIPPPLVDSPKCAGCSLVGICLPDETSALEIGIGPEPVQLGLFDGNAPRRPVTREVRPMITPRYEQRTLYLNTQGARVGKSGAVLQVREKDALLQEIRIGEICQVNLMGNVQISTQAIQSLCEAGVPTCYFSMGGWFYGITTGLNTSQRYLKF